MSSRAGNWMIAVGAIGVFAGFCFLPLAFGEQSDANLLSVGACFFSLGALTISSGIYLKALARQSKNGSRKSNSEPASPRRLRGGCDLCKAELPVINCKVHQLHLCGTCLAQHYDFRSCAYVPSTRRPGAAKAGKSAMARAH
jgi:hypothetical protein